MDKKTEEISVFDLLMMLESTTTDERRKLDCRILAGCLLVKDGADALHPFANPKDDTISIEQKKDAVKAIDDALDAMTAFLKKYDSELSEK